MTEDFVRQVGEVALQTSPEDIAVGGLAVGIILGAAYFYRKWRKGRGYRMVIKDRNDKIHSLLLDILTDGLLDAEMKGTISRQEHNATLAKLAKALDLKDLVPKKRHLKMLKEELKARRKSPRFEKERNHMPTIPGPKPPQVSYVKTKFVEAFGKSASKFFKRAA